MRQRKAFWTDIFFKFDLKNWLLTMTLTYKHFENKFNQLGHPENPTIDTKIVKIGLWIPKIRHFHFSVGGHIGFGPKRGLQGPKKFEPYDFLVIWTLMMQYPPLTQFGQTNLPNSIFFTSQPPLNWHVGRMGICMKWQEYILSCDWKQNLRQHEKQSC